MLASSPANRNRHAAQGIFIKAAQFAQGSIGFFDDAGAVAGYQHIRHGRQYAENELLRIFQFAILFFQRDFIVDQL